MESNTVVTIGLVAFAASLVFAGWRASRWLQNFGESLKTAIRADITAVRDEFTLAQAGLTASLNAAKAEFETVVKDMGIAHQAFRDETIKEFREIERDLLGFKLHVAQSYASKGDLQQSVQIIVSRIDGLVTMIEALKNASKES